MAKHFALAITDDDVTFERKTAQIEAEAALDGIYVLRTSLKPETLDAASTVKTYKQRQRSSAPFEASRPSISRSGRSIIAVPTACAPMCSCACSPTISNGTCARHSSPSCSTTTTTPPQRAARTSIVAKASAPRPPSARRLQAHHDGLPVHSFHSLLGDLATVTRNTMAMADQPDATFVLYPQLTPIQARAFKLLEVAVNL